MTVATLPRELFTQRVATERLYGRHSETRNLDNPTLPYGVLHRRETGDTVIPRSHRHRQYDDGDLTVEDLLSEANGFTVALRNHGPRRLWRHVAERYFAATLFAASAVVVALTLAGWTPW